VRLRTLRQPCHLYWPDRRPQGHRVGGPAAIDVLENA
jgi:hypothetical protein